MSVGADAGALVYLVVYMDGNWEGWGPVDPIANYGNPPPDLDEIEANLCKAISFMQDYAGGRFCLGAHTSTYCRDLFYREPLLGMYQELTKNGGEISVHPHEELVRTAPLVHAKEHMEAIILRKTEELVSAGVEPTSFRMALGAYDDALPSILEKAGIYVDLSATPGLDKWYWHAYWRDSPLSAHYLCPVDYTHVECSHPKADVLAVPFGNDGLGNDFSSNYLYNEAAPLNENKRVWDAIVRRAENAREPQFVYAMCHLSAMANDAELRNLASLLEYVRSRHGRIVTPSEAKGMFDASQEGSEENP